MYAASFGILGELRRFTIALRGRDRRIACTTARRKLIASPCSSGARAIDDVNFYRHCIGPLYTCWLTLLSPYKHNEQANAAFNLASPARLSY
jgi:hypothetical protein